MTTARRHASAPAWIGVALSILATLAAAANWQRNEDLRDIEQQIVEREKFQVERHQRTLDEIGYLREDMQQMRQEMATIMMSLGGR